MKRNFTTVLLVLCLLSFSSTAFSQSDGVMPVEIEADVVYGHKMGMALTFDVLKPADANGAAVLFMVSGGWFSRWAPPSQMASRFSNFLDEGFTVFAVRHGSAPLFKVPEAFADVKRATRYIHLNASDWGIDPSRIGVTGGSAGGHLSLMLGNTGNDGDPSADDPVKRAPSHIAAVVAYFPPVDLTGIVGPNDRFPALDFDLADTESVSPIAHVSADDPPSLMIHGDQDELVPLLHSERILSAFEEAGVDTKLIVIEGAAHGFRDDDATEAATAAVAWFKTYLSSSDTGATGGGE